MTVHPLKPGDKIRHINQQWATGEINTAEIVSVQGPFKPDGDFEYEVLAGESFANRLSESNPMTRKTMWNSRAILLVEAGIPQP